MVGVGDNTPTVGVRVGTKVTVGVRTNVGVVVRKGEDEPIPVGVTVRAGVKVRSTVGLGVTGCLLKIPVALPGII